MNTKKPLENRKNTPLMVTVCFHVWAILDKLATAQKRSKSDLITEMILDYELAVKSLKESKK